MMRHIKSLRRYCLISLLAVQPIAGLAGPGHDHGGHSDAPDEISADRPRRMENGDIFLPKPAQRQLGIATTPVKVETLTRVTPLNGRVVGDPQSGGLVQTVLGGRYLPEKGGVPMIGQTLKKGQALGYLLAPLGPLEQSARNAELAQLQTSLNQALDRENRLIKLKDTVPAKVMDRLKEEIAGLRSQIQALEAGTSSKEKLVSPISGVVSYSRALAGQVFGPGDTLFEIIDPSVVHIEADWFEPDQLPAFRGATVQAGPQVVQLSFLGAARKVQGQAVTLHFESRSVKDAQFATGQLITVYAGSSNSVEGFAIPASAIMKNPSNQTIVWVKHAPEIFEPKVVNPEPLDGAKALIRSGLLEGDRIVVQGASLLNQIR